MKIRQSIQEYEKEIKEIRQDLHKIPEYSFEEYQTSEYLMNYLQKLHPDSLKTVAKTGIKAVFMSKNAKKTIGIRADIDALPIDEKNKDCVFCSKNSGMMHACGHDGHMAIALICAKIISKAKNRLKNNYVFLFQPAEETDGGARPMIQAGALENPKIDEIYGLHLWPYIKSGKVGLAKGAIMAHMCDLNIEIIGKGSHGAKPHQGKDALVAAAQLIGSIQTIISRNLDPYKMAVITIGKITGGETRNVICEQVHLEGTIRTFDEDVTKMIKTKLDDMLRGIEKMFEVTCKFTESMVYNAVVNDEELYESAKLKFSNDEYVDFEPVMISEDFSEYQLETKGFFAFIGTEDTNHKEPLHSNLFHFDERVLLYGVEYFLRVSDFE
ncbi:MAG: M20 family metallopeptidase [Christensenellaceae bacterium]